MSTHAQKHVLRNMMELSFVSEDRLRLGFKRPNYVIRVKILKNEDRVL
jgi:hypothetical protein